jgi:hypothetical protein
MRFNPAGYLRPARDIVAPMTLEHQTQTTNLMTRLGRAVCGRGPAQGLAKTAVPVPPSYMIYSKGRRAGSPLREQTESAKLLERVRQSLADPSSRSTYNLSIYAKCYSPGMQFVPPAV